MEVQQNIQGRPAVERPSISAGALALSDLAVIDGGEPRIKDVRLGECLGMAQPLNIRSVIEKNRAELEGFGSIHAPREWIKAGKGACRQVTVYWLNEAQALLICMFSRTQIAAKVRHQIVTVFMDWRRGKTKDAGECRQLLSVGEQFLVGVFRTEVKNEVERLLRQRLGSIRSELEGGVQRALEAATQHLTVEV